MNMAKQTAKHLSMPLEGARVAVQGFGNVGSVAARMLQEQGCKIVAISDASGGVYRESGLDVNGMLADKEHTHNLRDSRHGDRITNAELLELPCDILMLAAMEGQITEANASNVKARIIVEGANGPTSTEADKILADKGVFIVPDILANAGGVIVLLLRMGAGPAVLLLGGAGGREAPGLNYETQLRVGAGDGRGEQGEHEDGGPTSRGVSRVGGGTQHAGHIPLARRRLSKVQYH